MRALLGTIRISSVYPIRSPEFREWIRCPPPISPPTETNNSLRRRLGPRPLGRSIPMTALQTVAISPVSNAMARSRQPELRKLTVLEFDDRIEIGGRVSSFYVLSVALETAKAASDGRAIVLHVEVDR
ncbi:MAG: hypothetical protein KF873_02990 [Gemmataceae bacterium]|nr:hypothetical protein [Gemmataceae bacterium]